MVLVTLFYIAKVMDNPTLIFVDKHGVSITPIVDKHGVSITPIVHCIQVFLKQWSFVWICQGAVQLYIIYKHFNCGMVDNKRQVIDEKAEKYWTKATTLWNAT